MDTTIKVTSIHLVVGILTGIISTGFTLRWFGFKNDAVATALAFIILYFVGQLSQKQFGEEISGGFSQWLWDGIMPFLVGWVITYTLLVTYL